MILTWGFLATLIVVLILGGFVTARLMRKDGDWPLDPLEDNSHEFDR